MIVSLGWMQLYFQINIEICFQFIKGKFYINGKSSISNGRLQMIATRFEKKQ